jgi:hypothetical protein
MCRLLCLCSQTYHPIISIKHSISDDRIHYKGIFRRAIAYIKYTLVNTHYLQNDNPYESCGRNEMVLCEE